MTIKGYSQQDTSILKGFAILCICLHNFFHHLPPSTGENEFYFSINHINNFFSQLSETPAGFVDTLFGYLGHYGVQVFIFISGYGLTLSMIKNHKSWLTFVVDRLKKLYPLLLTALIFYILYTILTEKRFPWDVHYQEMNYKLLFAHTLIPKQGTSVNGPWWFFGLIFQLYLIFPALFYLIKKYNVKALMLICLISYTWIYVSQYHFDNIKDVYLLQNFPGHLPEFCLGMFLAFNKDIKINNAIFFVALTLFCLGNFYKLFFPFTFLSVTIIIIFTYQLLKNIPIRKTLLKNFLAHFGSISMTLFAVHGFMRSPFLALAKNSLNTPAGHLYAALLFLVTAYIMSFAATQLYELLLVIFNKIKTPQKENTTTKVISSILQLSLAIFSVYIMYYCIDQGNNNDMKQITKEEHISKSLLIKKDSAYNTFASLDLDKNYKTIKIEGTMDLKNLSPDAKIPPIVIEVKGVLWDKIYVKGDFSNNNFNHCEFRYDYKVPFLKKLNNKNMKLYFWNTSKSDIELNNINVQIIADR